MSQRNVSPVLMLISAMLLWVLGPAQILAEAPQPESRAHQDGAAAFEASQDPNGRDH